MIESSISACFLKKDAITHHHDNSRNRVGPLNDRKILDFNRNFPISPRVLLSKQIDHKEVLLTRSISPREIFWEIYKH